MTKGCLLDLNNMPKLSIFPSVNKDSTQKMCNHLKNTIQIFYASQGLIS